MSDRDLCFTPATELARLYRALRRYEDRLILPRWHAQAEPSWLGFPITVTGSVKRERLVQWLEAANIETRQLGGGNILEQPGYRNIPHRVVGSLYRTNRAMRDAFFVGVYPGLTEEMVDYMIATFDRFFAAQALGRGHSPFRMRRGLHRVNVVMVCARMKRIA